MKYSPLSSHLFLASAIASLLTILLLASMSASATANEHHLNIDKRGVAIKGYDPVAYFVQNSAVKGDKTISEEHQGALYYFSSPAHRELFRKNPEQYLPQYNGYCAFGVTKNRKFDIDPKAFEVVNGKLYLNLNKKVQKIWTKNKAEFITEANDNWLKIEKISDKQLAKDW